MYCIIYLIDIQMLYVHTMYTVYTAKCNVVFTLISNIKRDGQNSTISIKLQHWATAGTHSFDRIVERTPLFI